MSSPNTVHQLTQGTIDAMLAAAAQQGENAGWRRGFLSALVCMALGMALEVLLHIFG